MEMPSATGLSLERSEEISREESPYDGLFNSHDQPVIHIAAVHGHVHVIKELVKFGYDVSETCPRSRTALHCAAVNGKEDVILYLLEVKPRLISSIDNDSQTALDCALIGGNTECITVLLNAGAKVKRSNSVLLAAVIPSEKLIRQVILDITPKNISDKRKRTPLHLAAEKGCIEVVKPLVELGLQLDYKCNRGRTPLHYAACGGFVDIVKILIENGSNLEAQDLMGMRPIHCAAQVVKVSVVNILIQNGADVNPTTFTNLTPLHLAALNGSYKISVDLLKHVNINPNIRSYDGSTPLNLAMIAGHERIVKILMDKKTMIDFSNVNDKYLLHTASLLGFYSASEHLINAGANVNLKDMNNKTPNCIAGEKEHTEIVELLLKHKADIYLIGNENCMTLPHIAVSLGNLDMLVLLATYDKRINEIFYSKTLLHIAVQYGHEKVVSFLLQNKCNVNAKNSVQRTPLHIAAINDHDLLINILVLAGANVNFKDRAGNSALHHAAKLGHLNSVQALIVHKSDIECSNNFNRTPLHEAVVNNRQQIVEMLLKFEADTNCKDIEGKTPLHFAVISRNEQIINSLVNIVDVDLNMKDVSGYTALHCAVFNDFFEIVRILIFEGADAYSTDLNGNTPFNIAAENGHIASLLELLDNKAKVRSADAQIPFSPLHSAALKNQVEAIEILVQAGANVNIKGVNDLTPLHIAAQKGSYECIRKLIKYDVLINEKDTFGSTALHHAATSSCLDVLKLLCSVTCDVNARDHKGWTPLYYAIINGHSDFIDILLLYKSEVNVRSIDCKTPLHLSVMTKHYNSDILDMMLKAGSNVNAVDNLGNTPLHLAIYQNEYDAVKQLLTYNADTTIKNNQKKSAKNLVSFHNVNMFIQKLIKND